MAILPCTCEHETQDKWYGKYKRVHNLTKKGGGNVYRCTVCGKERTLTESYKIESKQGD